METQKHPTIQILAMITGIALIVGILFPIIMPGFGIMFPELRALTADGVGIFAKMALIFPLVGAVLVFIGQAQPNYTTRAIFYFIAGFVPILFGLASASEMDMNMGNAFGRVGNLMGIGIFSYVLGLGLLGMVSAGFAGGFNRQSPFPGYAALGGGGLTALAMVFPINADGSYTVFLITPFQAIGHNFFIGLVLLIFVAGLVTAAVFSILWGINQKNGVNHANIVKWLVLGTFAFTLLMMFLAGFFEMFSSSRFFGVLILLFTSLIHSLASMLGAFLAKCLGIIELLTFTPAGPVTSPSSTDKFV